MAGPIALRSQKALMTRYCNALTRLVDQGEKMVSGGELRPGAPVTPEESQALIFQIEASSQLLLDTLSTFSATADSLIDSLNEDQVVQVQTYLENAHEALERAHTLAFKMDATLRSKRCQLQEMNAPATNSTQSNWGLVQAAQPRLPAIPIPTFSGKIWEYGNFWTLFSTNVHNQPLTNLQKFNYLLDALSGEARELVRRFPVTEENYELAVEMLQKKYGDNSKLASSLQTRLEHAKADRPTIPAQRRLLDSIIPIVMQLQKLNIHLDGSYLVQKVLAKFTPTIQRHVLEHFLPRSTSDSAWKMQDLLDALDDHITTEERISDVVDKTISRETHSIPKTPGRPKDQIPSCMFCRANTHKAANCSRYPTISDRRNIMQERKLCLNCGKQGHLVMQCLSKGCSYCEGKKHHHTLCPSRVGVTPQPIVRNTPRPQPLTRNTPTLPKPMRTPSRAPGQTSRDSTHPPQPANAKRTQAHPINSTSSLDEHQCPQTQPEARQDSVVLHHLDARSKDHEQVSLLTGCAQVWNTVHTKWKEVEILFDTGADRSFISEALAQDLGLDTSRGRVLTMYTFGSKDPKTAQSTLTNLNIWDTEGHQYSLSLYTAQNLTGTSKATRLSKEDMDFITYHGIRLSRPSQGDESRPQILLGCDQLWTFLESTSPRYTLPSGLQLIPSKFGYLLTGMKSPPFGTAGEPNSNTTNLTIVANTILNFDDDLDRWDRYWTIDSSGICEFTGAKDAEKDAVNAQVSKFFDDTIQRRPDGYYVRLPYKENHETLPSNKAIALRRLHSVLKMLESQPDLLDGYQEIMKEQADKGIIEEIPNDQPLNGMILHYIPHQPVVTPQKDTTKLRIVFDASSHFKGCPSLNDILHQGPLILPEIYAMLLRFRVAPYVVTSDVEKAFLQVHLHEIDRDATRFFWVRDVHKPVTEDNLVTFRFTRVTFGLNVSPFLLGATIHHHLRSNVEEKALAEEIQANLYVDNLILSADTKKDALQKSLKSRAIFADIGMNLREFLSNDPELCASLPADACAKSTTHKVLGITWNAADDVLDIQCNMAPTEKVTKRIVARQIASIYDPFGWLTPLLTQAKRFQQELWKHKYTWDEPLSETLCSQWNDILQKMHGFHRSFPRIIAPHSKDLCLAVFADASAIAMTACAYAFNHLGSVLIMAKGKLPSIKSTCTMPKLEMNAITIAMRLAHSIIQALKPRLNDRLRKIYIFSDSQIALNWLNAKPYSAQLGRLVENRLREIRRIAENLQADMITVEFRYVPTADNPADAGTRGLTKEQLITHKWWSGPEFLLAPEDQWVAPIYALNLENSCEQSDSPAVISVVHETLPEKPSKPIIDCARLSSFRLAKRTALVVLVFLKKLVGALPQEKIEKITSTIPELRMIPDSLERSEGGAQRAARLFLIRIHQNTYLTEGYRKSMGSSLTLFRDKDHIWKSRGRLQNSSLSKESKYPIFISPNTSLAELIIKDAHGPYHQGIEHTMATVRNRYWIPKLRQQVRKLVVKCVKCRRFNALPYPYPDSTDLPQRRVFRSRPFQHIGLDFFDLPKLSTEADERNPCGCIFTCTVTRLMHLELVPSMSTEDFINAFRRFVARRGIPDTITCDNAPTFLLAEKILAEGKREMVLNPEAKATLMEHEIQWKHITPYAPWQGGFYERLIKSVKHALYKALRSTRCLSIDHLRTILTEIESCLNSRPLTYQGSSQEEFASIRPIDFLQKEFEGTLPLAVTLPDQDDSEYHPPGEERTLQTQKEVLDALRSSCQATEKFWKIWHDQYLSSLRETHVKNITNKRHSQSTPSTGDVVLVSDPVLPRNNWRMARITDIRKGSDGNVREVELITAARRKIHRPVNLLVPLEIHDTENQDRGNMPTVTEGEIHPSAQPQRYNLRPRPPRPPQATVSTVRARCSNTAKWFLFHLMLLSLLNLSTPTPSKDMQISCTSNGISISTTPNLTFEICADNHCQLHKASTTPYLVKFPTQLTLHDHIVMVKWNNGGHLATMTTTCRALDFCENVDCWFCAQSLLNPECWPARALFLIMILLYLIVATAYALLYVPMTIGKPIRLISQGGLTIMLFLVQKLGRLCLKLIRKLFLRRRRTRSAHIAAALAIIVVTATQRTMACQLVNAFEHHSTSCTKIRDQEKCQTLLSEILKINTFHQEACLRLAYNSSLIANIRVRWKGLYLTCERETLYFTRSTSLRVLDSKRCATMGSCVNGKCAEIQSTSLIEELDPANSFPGRTGCMESCGGWGCDCWWPSSGCLFYRVYAVPNSPTTYEVFRCTRWSEEVKLEIFIDTLNTTIGKRRFVQTAIPNVPIDLPSFRLTMTSLTLPPTPSLYTYFITDGHDTAIWSASNKPHLICSSKENATSAQCIFNDDCRCDPAENKVNCHCSEWKLDQEFNNIALKLPVKTVSWELAQRPNHAIVAKIPHMVSAEFVIDFHGTFDATSQEITQENCTVPNNVLKGCYHCSKGAQTHIQCTSNSETLGEILCGNHAFVVPCAKDSPESLLRFHFDSARQLLNCSITCGQAKHYFLLAGILKFIEPLSIPGSAILSGNSTMYHEIKWPDFYHIFDVCLLWYKTLIVGLLIVASALLISYAFLPTLGLRLLGFLLRYTLKFLLGPWKIFSFVLKKVRERNKRAPAHEKNL
ncbi:hypothetical protein V3C99_011987 [Haemonchus contortus]